VAAANKAVLSLLMSSDSSSEVSGQLKDKKRGSHNKLTPEMKAKIAKEAIQIGNSAAARNRIK
jgi:hypothetical protein